MLKYFHQWAYEVMIHEKTETQTSRATVPLTVKIYYNQYDMQSVWQ